MRSPPASPLAVARPPAAEGRSILIAQGVRLIVRLASAAILARLLTPEAYGEFGMAAAVYGLLSMARDFGIVTALQAADITPHRFNALCRFGFIGGLALTGLGAALAAPTGWFFAENPTVPGVLAVMSSAFIFSGLGAPAVGILYREKQAGRVAQFEAVGITVGSSAAVVAAWAGAGVWSLVLMGIVTEFVVCVLAWRACPWRPSRATGDTPWFSLATLAAHLTGHNLATYVTRALDQAVVGRVAGAGALGLYGRGAQIAALPAQYGIGPFSPFVVAGLARLRGSADDYRAFFRKALNGLYHVSLAGAAACVAIPDLLVRAWFGDQWIAAAPVVRWLGVALAVQPALSAPFWLLGASGESRRLLQWAVCGAVLMGGGCWFAAPFGFAAVAQAAATTAVLHAALGPAFCAHRTPVTLRDWLTPLLRPAFIHGAAASSVIIAHHFILTLDLSILARATILAGLAAGVYGAIFLGSARARSELREHMFWSR